MKSLKWSDWIQEHKQNLETTYCSQDNGFDCTGRADTDIGMKRPERALRTSIWRDVSKNAGFQGDVGPEAQKALPEHGRA